ncbi:MAG: DUF2267 domain-containing protein [Caulobacterales bacterium]
MPAPTQAGDIQVESAADWAQDVAERLSPCSREEAAQVLRATLEALRERISATAAVTLTAQLPDGLRAELLNARPPRRPRHVERSAPAFAAKLARQLPPGLSHAPMNVACAVFEVIASRFDPAELAAFTQHLPATLAALWPSAAGTAPEGLAGETPAAAVRRA